MTDAERMQLHADLARLLAPLVGEAAVYDEEWECVQGHRHRDWVTVFHHGGIFCSVCWLEDKLVEADRVLTPKALLTAPAVLEPLLRQVCREKQWNRDLRCYSFGHAVVSIQDGKTGQRLSGAPPEEEPATDTEAWALALRRTLAREEKTDDDGR